MQIMRVWATTTQNSRKWPNVDDGQIKRKNALSWEKKMLVQTVAQKAASRGPDCGKIGALERWQKARDKAHRITLR